VHAPAIRLEQVRDRRAEGGVPAMADVKRPGRVRRDELDQRPPAGAIVAAPVTRTFLEHAAHLGLPGGGRHEEVDEARARDLGLRDEVVRGDRGDDRLRELARIGARGLGEAHRDAGREVAVRDVAAALDRGIGRRRGAERAGWQSRERVQYELFDAIFQALNSISIDFGRIDVERPAQRTRRIEFRELVDPLGEESLQCPTNR